MEKISWLDKVTNKKVLKRVHEGGQANTEHLFSKGNIDSLAMFWDTTDFAWNYRRQNER